jgi:hypothetical protein
MLNHDCTGVQRSIDKHRCEFALEDERAFSSFAPDDTYRSYMLQQSRQAHLHLICDADWIPAVARECAAARARLEKLKLDNRARVSRLRASALFDAKLAVEKAAAAMHACANNQAAKLILSGEPAEAIAGAAITLCRREVETAAQAVVFETDLKFWSEGPQPQRPGPTCRLCLQTQKGISQRLSANLAAKIMQERAEAVKPRPNPDDLPAQSQPPPNSTPKFGI